MDGSARRGRQRRSSDRGGACIALRDRWQALYRQRWEGVAAPAELEREIVTALSATRTRELLASRDAR